MYLLFPMQVMKSFRNVVNVDIRCLELINGRINGILFSFADSSFGSTLYVFVAVVWYP